jgi:hypothetical protein
VSRRVFQLRRPSRPVAALFTLAAAAWMLAPGFASSPTFWQSSTQADFLKGQVENLSIDNDGRVLLGPASELVSDTAAPFVWTLTRGLDDSLLAGSGNDGKVFRIDKAGAMSTIFDAPELEVHALAVGRDGTLFAGTSPDGKVYRIPRAGDAGSVAFDPEDKYIWALAVDAEGTLFCATGEKGVIYRIGPDGQGEPFYQTKATHVTALAFDPAGNLLAGTESPGQVLRIDRAGRGFVLLDSGYREIHAIRLDERGTIYAAATSARPGAAERAPDRPPTDTTRLQPTPSVSTEITVVAIGPVQAGPASPEATRRREEARGGSQGAVYRIAPNGIWDTVWESGEDTPYDISVDSTGALFVATGPKGKIFRIEGSPVRVTLLARAAAQQVTRLMKDATGRQHYATANPGKIFRLSSQHADRGSYESEVRDASTVATWGSIRWRATTPAGSAVEIATRSGNTASPDETWSPWSTPYTNPDGEQVASPNARYLQWRASFIGKTQSPILTSVTAAYLERNLRPEVASVTVHPSGVVFQKPFSTGELEIAGYEDPLGEGRTAQSSAAPAAGQGPSGAPALGRRVYQKGLQTFVWKADDKNNDRLQFDVLYRAEGETAWRPLRRGLNEPILVWDTSSVPDGTYTIKVVASDTPSNSPGASLEGEMESTSFDIDNTPPVIEIQSPRREGDHAVIRFAVRDRQSPVQRVEYSLDANRWRVIYPKDGIPDARYEEFEIVLDGDNAARSAIIRATDTMNNAATAVGEASPPRAPARP